MRENIIEQGVVRKVDQVDRGGALLFTIDGWRERNIKVIKKNYKKIGLIVVLILISFNVVVHILLPNLTNLTFFLLTTLVPIMLMALSYATRMMTLDSNAPPGIYSKGIQHPESAFVPYRELKGLFEGHPPRHPERTVLLLMPRSPDEADGTIPEGWYIDPKLIGDEGIEVVRQKIAEFSEGDGPADS